MQNCRPILSVKLKKVQPDLIFLQQTRYVKNRHFEKSGRLISDAPEIIKAKKDRRLS